MTVTELIRASDTSFYVFDTAVLKKRTEYLRNSLPKNVRLCYAVKANTFIAGAIQNEVDCFEICSPGEAHICGDIGIPPEKTVISGLYKTPSHIEELVKSSDGRTYTAESPTQLKLLAELAEKYDKRLCALIRITNDSQFGMNEEDALNALADKNYSRLDFYGLQYFSGTQKTSLKKLRRELLYMNGVFAKAREIYGDSLDTLEYGTGFPVMYFKDEEFNEDEFLAGFSELLGELDGVPKITLELGRSIAASCGKYYTRIVDIKHNKGLNYVITDGGMHQLVYYGQQMAMRQPFFAVCGKENEEPTGKYNICGSLCSMNDIILKNAPLPDVDIGDTIRFDNTGAYCPTEGISLFLSRELPAIYLSDGNDARCVRLPFETYVFNSPVKK